MRDEGPVVGGDYDGGPSTVRHGTMLGFRPARPDRDQWQCGPVRGTDCRPGRLHECCSGRAMERVGNKAHIHRGEVAESLTSSCRAYKERR